MASARRRSLGSLASEPGSGSSAHSADGRGGAGAAAARDTSPDRESGLEELGEHEALLGGAAAREALLGSAAARAAETTATAAAAAAAGSAAPGARAQPTNQSTPPARAGAAPAGTASAALVWDGARRRRVAAVFVAALGIQLGVNVVFGSVADYSSRFGSGSFLWINVAVYLPFLPVSLLSPRLLFSLERGRGVRASARAGVVAPELVMALFGASGLLCALLGPVGRHLPLLLVVVSCIGALSALQYNAVMSLAMQAASKGWHEMAVSFGFQASIFVVLAARELLGARLVSLACAVVLVASSSGVYLFCDAVAPGSGVSADIESPDASTGRPRAQAQAQVQAQPQAQSQAQPPAQTQHTGGGGGGSGNAGGATQRELLRVVWPHALILFLTVFGSVLLFPFFSYAPSSAHSAERRADFSAVLFYVKSVADTLSRPVTVATSCGLRQDGRALLGLAAARIVLGVPLFFAYCFSTRLGRSDVLFCLFVATFSATSGLFITYAYQLGAELARKRLPEGDAKRVSGLLNLAFQTGILAALICAVLGHLWLGPGLGR
jgi:hypothetical protein